MAYVTQVYEDVFSCDDCGAYARTPEGIKHHATCVPGTSRYWQERSDPTNLRGVRGYG